MDLEQLLSLNQTARQEGQELSRYRPLLTRLLGYKARAFAGIIGARGTGKTVLLKQLATRWPDAFYISLDTAPRIDLFEVAEVLSASYGIKTLLLDEIHHYPGIHQELKKLYDFTSMRVVFTSSVALLMHETTHDLSRRVRLFPLSVLSFREFLMFSQNHDLPSVSFEDVVSAKLGPKYRLFDHLFTQYLCSGILPFSLHDPEPLELLRNIVTTVVQKDIPKVQDLKTSELDEVSNVIEFSAKSAADGVNPTSIGKNLGITKYKAAQYLDLLERAFIIKQIRAYGTNVLKEPKVLLMPPYRLLYRDYEQAKGALREEFVAEMLSYSGNSFFYLKNRKGKKCPDFLVTVGEERFVLEVGGAGKGANQFKGLSGDFTKLIFQPEPSKSSYSRPLSSLGFLY